MASLNSSLSKHIIVDSRDRDTQRFPNPSHYEIELDESIRGVVSIQLLLVDIPFSSYLVETNQQITATTDDAEFHVSITSGDYDEIGLASEIGSSLQAAADNVSYDATFGAAYNPLLDNIGVSCSKPFKLVFNATGSIARELGFPENSTTLSVPSNASHIVTPPFRRDAHKHPYVVLSIESASVNTSTNSVVHQSFAVLTPQHNNATRIVAMKSFNPPIRMTRVVVDLRNRDGTYYNFHNQDHRMELLFTTYQSPDYQPRFNDLRMLN